MLLKDPDRYNNLGKMFLDKYELVLKKLYEDK
jgi:hypothetical protein